MTETTTAPPAGASAPSVKNRRARRVLALILIILILLFGLAAYLLYRTLRVPMATSDGKSVDTGLVWVRSIYGTSERREDLFGQTAAAVPGDGGTIWITDVKHRSSIMQFSPDGHYLGSLESVEQTMPIRSPSRVAVGPDGRIYICETAYDRIHVLQPNGEDGGSFNVPQPVSVAVNEDRIAVGAVSGFAVLDKTGKPIGVVGSRGKGPDQFDYVHGIAFGPDGSIYVADSYNNRLSAYESDGELRWRIRTGAPANSADTSTGMLESKPTTDVVLKGGDALQLPLGLTVDGAGRVVVADMYECCLAVFEPKKGKLVGKYGDYGAEDGKFFYPVSVGYDSGRDWFTVADAFNERVQIVRIPGSSSGAGVTGAIRRALAGPLRACLFPLLLLLIALIALLVVRHIRRRRGTAESGELEPSAERALETGVE